MGSAQLASFKSADLLVMRADYLALRIVQAGPVQGAGQMVFSKLSLGSGVNHIGKFCQTAQRIVRGNKFKTHARALPDEFANIWQHIGQHFGLCLLVGVNAVGLELCGRVFSVGDSLEEKRRSSDFLSVSHLGE